MGRLCSSAPSQRGSAQRRSFFERYESSRKITVRAYSRRFFPYVGTENQGGIRTLDEGASIWLVFTHYRHDLHQVTPAQRTEWNTFRDHLIPGI